VLKDNVIPININNVQLTLLFNVNSGLNNGIRTENNSVKNNVLDITISIIELRNLPPFAFIVGPKRIYVIPRPISPRFANRAIAEIYATPIPNSDGL
jgi:hypothetical protein